MSNINAHILKEMFLIMKWNESKANKFQQQYFTKRKVLKSHCAILLPIYLGHMQK